VRTGKRLEMPVKRPLQGVGPTAVVDLGALGYPDALAAFARVVANRRAQYDIDPCCLRLRPVHAHQA
jgi:hypothetical protein